MGALCGTCTPLAPPGSGICAMYVLTPVPLESLSAVFRAQSVFWDQSDRRLPCRVVSLRHRETLPHSGELFPL